MHPDIRQHFRLVQAFAALTLSLALCATTIAAPLPDFTANYSLHKGFLGARATVTFEVNGDSYVYYSLTEPTGLLAVFRSDRIVERSSGVFRDGLPRPLTYQFLHTNRGKTKRDVQLVFDWDHHEVANTVKGHTWTMPIPDGTLDKFVVQLAVMIDLERGGKNLEYKIADGGKLKTYGFAIEGKQTVDTPAGEFSTIKVMRIRDSDSKRETYLWCAPKLDYLPVRAEHIDNDGNVFTMDLDKVDGIQPSRARQETEGHVASGLR
jgi:hypothetical protein